MVVSDNGTEGTSNAMFSRQQDRGVERHYVSAGELMQSGFVENFNGRLRENARAGICSAAAAMPVE